MPNDSELGHYMQSHMIDMLRSWKEEADSYIRDDWGGYFDRLIVAQDTATKNQQDALKEAENVQKEAEMLFDDALAVLAVATSFAGAWISASFQYRASEALGKWAAANAGAGGRFAQFVTRQANVLAKDKVAAKMFAEVGKSIYFDIARDDIKWLFDEASEPKNAIDFVTHSSSLEELRTNLNQTMRGAAKSVQTGIDKIMQAFRSTDTPRLLVEGMRKDDPWETATDNPEKDGQNYVNRLVNTLRELFRGVSHYFDYKPPDQSLDWRLKRHLEYEMWVLWLLHNKSYFEKILNLEDEVGGPWGKMAEVENFDREKSWFESVMNHMNLLNLPVANLLSSHLDVRFDAIKTLLAWAENHRPQTYLAEINMIGTRRPVPLTPIENWTPNSP